MDKLLPPPPLASDERFSILANIAAERFAQLESDGVDGLSGRPG